MRNTRATDYDAIADRFDRRYDLYRYDGVRDTLKTFIKSFAGSGQPTVLEVGCGTGHWLSTITGIPGGRSTVAGLEPSAPMLERARRTAPAAWLVRGRAEDLPLGPATFDRVFCINALHHFTDRERFFAEARRVLGPGGGLLTVGKDPHTGRDSWWVYDYFPETREIDRTRFAPVRTLRGELTQAGFAWAESFEADRIEHVTSATLALAAGLMDGSFTSQLAVLTEAELQGGIERIRAADHDAEGQLQLVSDFSLFATVGWVE